MGAGGCEPKRELPYDVDIEQAALGALMVDSALLDQVAGDLRPFDFYDPLHGRIAEAILDLHQRGQMVTPLTVRATIGADEPMLAEVGGLVYFNVLAAGAPVMPAVSEYLRVLRDLSGRRHVIHVGTQLVDAAYSLGASTPIAPIINMATETLCNIVSGAEEKRPQAAEDVAMRALQAIEEAKRGKPIPRVRSGLFLLDDQTGGLHAGDLILVPGRSGMGKSSLLGGIAMRAALGGYPVLVFSLEMAERQWMERTLCDLDYDDLQGRRPLEYRAFRKGVLGDDEFDRVARAQQRLGGLTFDIIDDDRLTIDDIAARAKSFKAKHGGIGLIVIDYLQIVVPISERGRSRENEVTAIARGAKSLAKRLGWPVMAGAQILRSADKRDEKERRPQLADIRESGSLENEADLIIAPYRPAFYIEARRPGSDSTEAERVQWRTDLKNCAHDFELLGLKDRHGPKFALTLHCDIGASAIRDQAPLTVQQQEGRGLLV